MQELVELGRRRVLARRALEALREQAKTDQEMADYLARIGLGVDLDSVMGHRRSGPAEGRS